MSRVVGLIGAGEAGCAIAAGLRKDNGTRTVAYDVRGSEEPVRERASAAGIELVGSLAELCAATDTILGLTSAKVAVAVAESLVPGLTADHVYSDWNSASPALMRQVAAVIGSSGAGFADGAVMAAVPPHGHRVPVLLSGGAAVELHDRLAPLHMQLEVIGSDPGQASAVKMFRSLLVKGLEALLLECAVGAQEYGATERVLTSMNGSLPTGDWNELAAYLLTRTLAHGERRAEELRQAAETLDDIGLEPHLAAAGARRLQWLVDLGVADEARERGLDYADVLALISKVRS